ncbi:VIT domain-containing protein [Desulfopila sp. IMCC35008]|uniref:VIT domain-containing protein n=1 Tax=Desulfopila sp. IMCC35008 TaxID=2653858 RepID=UPI0013D7E37E|nr:VIT domain-containing protein [Desulfopila sp. IMCC35008]
MNSNNRCSLFTGIVTALAVLLILTLFGKSTQAAGLLKPKNGQNSDISIKSHDVNVTINNGFARTEVDQVFTNSGASDLEAVYTFPLPRQASLSELSLWINGVEVTGEVLEKKQAKQVYEDQQAKGNSTALTEKDEYKTFTISVSPVKAQDDTRVRLVYYQPLEIDLNVGRYVYPLAEGGVDDERIAFWSVDSSVQEKFSFNLTLKSAQPIKDVRMPGYMQQAQIQQGQGDDVQGTTNLFTAQLENREGATLSEDVVIYYRLDDTVPARVELIPYKEEGAQSGTFMLVITPGASLTEITEGTDWVFVLDTSGSMSGQKIETLANGVAKAITKMHPADRFRIITFNNSATDFTNGFIEATPDNVNEVIARIKTIQAGGGTNLEAGLSKGLSRSDRERTTAVVLVTDGVANIGATTHQEFLQLVNQRDLRLFTFIIGNSANTPLLDKITKASGGFAMDISTRDDIYGRILQAKNKMFFQALHDAEVSFKGGGIKQVTPTDIGSLYRGDQLVMFGRYTQPEQLEVTFKAKISGENKQWRTSTVLPDSNTENPEIERLWALASIQEIVDEIDTNGENRDRKEQIINLGTEYSLVTDYTSMIVLSEAEFEGLNIERRNRDRIARERTAQQQRAQQPVKNYRVDSTPENSMFKGNSSPGIGVGPAGPVMLIVIAGGLFLARRREKK